MSNNMYDNITGRSPIATDDLGYIGTGKKASQIMLGGTTDYDALTNKPTINSVELSGNKTSSDLGLQSALTEPQIAAVNSGVTSETVSQVETNKNNILKQQDTVASGGNGYAIINGIRLYIGGAPIAERLNDKWIDGNSIRNAEYLLSSAPLCAIGSNIDTLNLATGSCTRYIKKLVVTGAEDWKKYSGSDGKSFFYLSLSDQNTTDSPICSHWEAAYITTNTTNIGVFCSNDFYLRIRPTNADTTTKDDFVAWLTAQNTANTPVTVYYVLATPTTETITIPTGNTGTVDGYLTQSGTPTPTAPVYPIANEVIGWNE